MLQSNSLSPGEVPAFDSSTPADAVPPLDAGPADIGQSRSADAAQPAGPAGPAEPADTAEGARAEVPINDPSSEPQASIEEPSSGAPGPEVCTDAIDVVPFDLDNRQRLALVSLARGSSMTKACEEAGIGRTTLYRWINEDARFSAAYNRWKAVCQMSAHGQVLALQDLALQVLREQLEFKRDAKLAARVLEKTGAMSPPAIGPTHPGRAAAHLTADQRQQDADAAKRIKNADHAVLWIPDQFRFADKPQKG
jgi:transposase